MFSIKIKKIILSIAKTFYRILFYQSYDSTAYWKQRALNAKKEDISPGNTPFFWNNQYYNQLFREDQKRIIQRIIETLKKDLNILDVGCGLGCISKMIVENFPFANIDAIDFEEAIAIAKSNNSHPRINYISILGAENYMTTKKYDLIVSSGAYSSIRIIENLEKSFSNGVKMLSPGGKILMIDAFHSWSYLARTKYSVNDVITYMEKEKMKLNDISYLLFWPYRELYSCSNLSKEKINKKYKQGEKILKLLGGKYWSDYKVLVFEK